VVSAAMSARSTARTEGVDKTRALQRVLYRSVLPRPEVNDDDEPCAGEPHARFLGEGLETDATAHGGRTNPAGKPPG